MSWRDQAACKGMDPDLFFPERGDNHGVAAAKAVCARCPVQADCGAEGVGTWWLVGVWGGMTTVERMQARTGGPRRNTRPVECATCGTTFAPKQNGVRYCSRACVNRARVRAG